MEESVNTVEEIKQDPPFDLSAETNRTPSDQPNEANSPKELTELDMRKLRRLYVTKQHPRISECGHKFRGTPPNTNCEWCWFVFFNQDGELVKRLDEDFRNQGPEPIRNMFGDKFLKMFLRFMSTVAKFMIEQENKDAETQKGEADICAAPSSPESN